MGKIYYMSKDYTGFGGNMNFGQTVLAKVLTGTLEAGHTDITFTDESLTSESVVAVATLAGINPTAMTTSSGSVTLYFPSQVNDITVKVVIF